MLTIRHAASILPALLLLMALALVACPAAKRDQPPASQQSASATGAKNTQQHAVLAPGPQVDPAPALEYISAALAEPAADGNAPLGPVWNAIAQLAGTPQAELLGAVRDAIISQAATAGDTTPPPLAGAWLAVQPAEAQAFIRAKLKDGQYTYLQALANTPELLREELARLNLVELPLDCAQLTLELLRRHGVSEADAPVLMQLAGHSEPTIRLRAIGYLKALDKATQQQEQELLDSVASEEQPVYVAALEGVKCSGAAEFADALVPLVAHTEMGEEDAAAPKDPRVLYAAYTLAYLPGEQATLMRNNLLGARDPQVRWQARLGELLNGQPSYWNDAVDLDGCASMELWVALQPPEAAAPALLQTYTQAVQADDVKARGQAAWQLARYTSNSERHQAIELLAQLAADSDPHVAAAALASGTQLKAWELIPAAKATLDNDRLPWETRLAAAGCLLAFARVPQEEQPK